MRKILFPLMMAALALGLAQMLTGCDMATIPTNPTAAQIDSGRAKLDSVNAGKSVKLHAWQVCAAGITTEPPCPMCQQEPFAWGADFLVHRDSAAAIAINVDRPVTCRPLGLFADTTTIKLNSITSNSRIDSAWYQMDGVDSVRYWIVWRRVTLHPDSLALVADSAKNEDGRGLRERLTW